MNSPRTEPATETLESRLLQRYQLDASSRNLGIELIEAAEGRVVMSMEVQNTMLNGHNILHGGYLFTLGDTCFAFVCESTGHPSVSRQAEITYIAPGSAESTLVATGVERTRYGRNNIVDVTIRDESGTHLAEMRILGVTTSRK